MHSIEAGRRGRSLPNVETTGMGGERERRGGGREGEGEGGSSSFTLGRKENSRRLCSPKWILLKWIKLLNEYHLFGPI